MINKTSNLLQVTTKSSRREKIVKRTFNMAKNKGLCECGTIHNFSRWAKGKAESTMLRYIDSGCHIPTIPQKSYG